MTDQADPQNESGADEATPVSGPVRTTVAPRWMRKMLIFLIVCFGLGTWGLLDAAVIYPNRGERYSEFMLAQYLEHADKIGVLPIARRVNVDDPAAALADLEARADQLDEFETFRMIWLKSLEPIHGKPLTTLTEQNQEMASRPAEQREDTVTVFQDPDAVFTELSAELQGASPPKPLSQTDIAVQWLICAAGYLGTIFIVFRIVQTKSTVYRYEPAEHKLILPGGKTITPDEIEVVDKSKWHKFFVTLELKDGSAHKFDLLRFEPLEEWILDMEESDPRLRAAREEAEADEEEAEGAESGTEDDQQP
jgi:hypothetical protein